MTRSRITLIVLVAVIGGMLLMAFQAKALYGAFCTVTGFGGTTRVAKARPSMVLDREVTVSLDANVGTGTALVFKPVTHELKVRLGETAMAFFDVENPSAEPVTAIAGYNVAPHKTGIYFDKLECFCFSERTFAPHEKARLPVIFYVDPALDKDKRQADVTDITLSYTFYDTQKEAENQTARLEDAVRRQ